MGRAGHRSADAGLTTPLMAPTSDTAGIVRRAISALSSNPAAAEALAREVLAVRPTDRDAILVLGSALCATGRAIEAKAVLAPLAAEGSDSWVVQFEWGKTLIAVGESRAATVPLERASELNPRLAGAWRLLGDVALAAGDPRGSQAAYDRMLPATIDDPSLAAAAAALADGRAAAAESALREALARNPRSAAAMHLLGEALARQGRPAEALAALEACVRAEPGLRLARTSYALALQRAGRRAEALTQIEDFLRRDPEDNRALMVKAALLAELGDTAAAAEATAKVLERFSDQPNAWLVYGNMLRTLGRASAAVEAWRRAISLDPRCGAAFFALANLKTYAFSDEERGAMRQALADPSVSPEIRADFHFALGQSAEADGDYGAAFAEFSAGAAIERARRPYDPAATGALVDRSKALFTTTFFEERFGWGAADPAPIFIVGLPRSGSTLVDQILASHPAVEGLQELMEVQWMADWTAREAARPYPDSVAGLSRGMVAQLGRDYLERTRPRRRLGRPRFTDKAPWNFVHVGLIRTMLPDAKIIDVRRHPLACCLSAFKQHFASGFDFTYDLDSLGRYYADYVDLMAHFDAVIPGAVHRVIYEELVDNTEAETRRVLDFLGLPFDPACLRFFETSRPIATPSSEQVRRPIFVEGKDQWRAYEAFLKPLRAALGPALDAYPAAPPS
jgi:tetratricopeptide (TPR) repeat protein